MSRFPASSVPSPDRGPSPAPTDELVRAKANAYRAGDAEAREWFFTQLQAIAERFARWRRRSLPAVAAMEQTGDVLQDALMKLLRRYDSNQEKIPETVRDLELAARGALNDTVKDANRKHLGPHGWLVNHGPMDNPGADVADDQTSASGLAGRKELGAVVKAFLAELPEVHRRALLMHELDHMTFVEIGAALGVHPKTAAAHRAAALKALARHLARADLLDD